MKHWGYSIVLAFMLVLNLPLPGWSQFAFTTNNGAIIITSYTGTNNIVLIPSVTNGYPVTTIGTDAFFNKTAVISVAIPDSVTNIGYAAFSGCSSLTDIVVNVANSNYASEDGVLFSHTLTVLDQYPGGLSGGYIIPNGVIEIGDGAFLDCSQLASIKIPSTVTTIGYAAFNSCSGLTNVMIPDSITNIGSGAFGGCQSLKTVIIPNSIASISDDTFGDCLGLTNVVIPNSITNIGSGAFWGCQNLTTLIIPNSVTIIGYEAFYLCSQLTNVTMGNSVANIGDDAFANCTSLNSVMIPNSVTNIGVWAFSGCLSLQQAYFQGNAPSVDGVTGSMDNTIFNGFHESGVAYFIPGTTGWDTTFGDWPTAQWYQPQPQILGSGYGLGVQNKRFQFTISWATNTVVVVEISTNLQNWTPVITNSLVSGTSIFIDSKWTNFPQQFYRVRSP